VIELDLLARADIEVRRHQTRLQVTRQLLIELDLKMRELIVVARTCGAITGADAEDRYAVLEERVVVIGREHDDRVRICVADSLSHLTVEASNLVAFRAVISDEQGEIRVMSQNGRKYDLCHRYRSPNDQAKCAVRAEAEIPPERQVHPLFLNIAAASRLA
jgi:hypothetical protein